MILALIFLSAEFRGKDNPSPFSRLSGDESFKEEKIMLILFGTTITTSFFDSLNPSAIAQQMVLQAMVKNKRHIWFFIFGIGLANFGMGLAIYYGVAAWLSRLFSSLVSAYPMHVYGTELLAGILCLGLGIRFVFRARRSTAVSGEDEVKAPAQISPLSLFFMGAGFCFVELTSALPYFGFLAVLAGYRLSFLPSAGFMLLYDFMYMLPLILLYFGYHKLQGTALIRRLEQILQRISAYVVPGVVSVAGVFLLCSGTVFLL